MNKFLKKKRLFLIFYTASFASLVTGQIHFLHNSLSQNLNNSNTLPTRIRVRVRHINFAIHLESRLLIAGEKGILRATRYKICEVASNFTRCTPYAYCIHQLVRMFRQCQFQAVEQRRWILINFVDRSIFQIVEDEMYLVVRLYFFLQGRGRSLYNVLETTMDWKKYARREVVWKMMNLY